MAAKVSAAGQTCAPVLVNSSSKGIGRCLPSLILHETNVPHAWCSPSLARRAMKRPVGCSPKLVRRN